MAGFYYPFESIEGKTKYKAILDEANSGEYVKAYLEATNYISKHSNDAEARLLRGSIAEYAGKQEDLCKKLSAEIKEGSNQATYLEALILYRGGWRPQKGVFPFDRNFNGYQKAIWLADQPSIPKWSLFVLFDYARWKISLPTERKVAARVITAFPNELAAKLCWAKSLLKGSHGTSVPKNPGSKSDLQTEFVFRPADDWSRYRESEGINYLKGLIKDYGEIPDLYYWVGFGYAFHFERTKKKEDARACRQYWERFLVMKSTAKITDEHKAHAKSSLERLVKASGGQ